MNALAATAGALLSLLMAYVPGLSTWFNAQAGTTKRMVMAFLIIVSALASVTAGCLNVFQQYATSCDQAGIEAIVLAVISSLVANQSVFVLAVKDTVAEPVSQQPTSSDQLTY